MFYSDDFSNPIGGLYDNGCELGFNENFGMDAFNNFGMGYKPLKATTRNVEEAIAMQLGVDAYNLDFIKLDEPPSLQNWKHSCYQPGVTKMIVNEFIFEDGSNIIYAVCPFCPQCNKVHFYVDRGQY